MRTYWLKSQFFYQQLKNKGAHRELSRQRKSRRYLIDKAEDIEVL